MVAFALDEALALRLSVARLRGLKATAPTPRFERESDLTLQPGPVAPGPGAGLLEAA